MSRNLSLPTGARPSRAALLAPIANPAVADTPDSSQTHEYARLRLTAGPYTNGRQLHDEPRVDQ